jgi:predicted CXXCH cytochrome family protein
MWMFQTLKIVPAHVLTFEGERLAILGFGVLLTTIAAVPLLEARWTGRSSLAPGIFTLIGWALLLYVLIMTLSGYLETPVLAAWIQEGDPEQLFKTDIHNQRGLSCGDCHGDNPQPKKSEVAPLCARCHSDPNYMRRFNPQIRVDQFAEYQTSVHGMRNATGDENVATCTNCHSVHDIRAVRDPKSPVYPAQIVSTCAKCHADPKHMAGYKIPTDQFEKYRKSVHAAALLDRHDLAAPGCNSCHGNHGARPPGVDSVPAVCSQCHRQERDLFSKSPHAGAFQTLGLAGCVVCHENHEIRKTDDRMLSVVGDGVCAACHTDDESKARIVDMQSSILKLRLDLDTASEVLGRGERAGMEVSKPKFDLDQANVELIKARVSVHAFNPQNIADLTTPATKIVAAARKSADNALEEVGIRRRGLGFALIAIALTIVGLILKIREIEGKL